MHNTHTDPPGRNPTLRPLAFIATTAMAATALMACAARPPFARGWDTAASREVRVYTLSNKNGLIAKISNYGATVTELHVPDRDGALADVVLGFDRIGDYRERSPYFGATVGRVANRIAGGGFELDGKPYALARNNGRHHLHGGNVGFDKVVWQAEPFEAADGPALRLSYRSTDGEEGYPGNVDVTVTYTLTQANALRIAIRATTDAPTPISIAHHGYWNLAGHAAGDIRNHQLTLHASSYTPTDAELIPTGQIESVAGTPFDFSRGKAIGADFHRMHSVGDAPVGYDVNFVVDGDAGQLRPVADVYDSESGRHMRLQATAPGVQLYTGNFLDGLAGKGGATYGRYAAFCLETQHFPNAINEPRFPSPLLHPGETYEHVMVHAFSVRQN